MAIFMLSLTGIPPLAGFAGKLYIFTAAVSEGYLALAVIAVLNSVISTAYYMRVLVVMFMTPGTVEVVGAGRRPYLFTAIVFVHNIFSAAQDVAIERSLFTQHKVKAFLYNQQVTDTLTESFITLAQANGIPVVGVYETMPEPGYHYQSWMLAEVRALRAAVTDHVSSEHL